MVSFSGGAKKTLTFELFGKDKSASKAVQNFGRETNRLGTDWKRVGRNVGLGLAAVGAGVVALATSSVKEYALAEEAHNKLAFAFKKFPLLADTNVKAIEKLNLALQAKTRFDDEAIASGQAIIAQFGLTGKQLIEVTPLLLDYAAKTGKDVPQAATDLGKALLGNTRALKNIGIDYKLTGDKTKDFTAITGLMREKVGGFAAKEGQTAIGKLDRMKNAFGEVKEKLGAVLLPKLIELGDWLLKTGIPKLEEFVGWVKKNAHWLGPLATGLGVATGAMWALNVAMDANPIGAVIAGVTLLITGIVTITQNFDKLHDELRHGKSRWILLLGVILPFINITLMVNLLVKKGDQLWKNLGTTIGRFASGMVRWMAQVMGTVRSWSRDTGANIAKVIAWFAGIPRSILRIFGNAKKWLIQKGRDVLDGFFRGLTAVWRGIAKWFSGIASWIKKHKGPIELDRRLLEPHGRAIMQGFRKGLEGEYGAVQGSVSRFAGGIASKWAPLVRRALILLGQPVSLVPAVLRRIQMESGGNPRAINLWDSNAKRGTPSKGLMQTIDPTFNAYAGPFRSWGVYNPMANIFAGLNYALHRYGSIRAIDPLIRPIGYDQGGVLPPGLTLVANKTGKPEYVIPPSGLQVSLEGAQFVMEIDGEKVIGVIKRQIADADRKLARTVRRS